MATAPLFSASGDRTGEAELSDALFGQVGDGHLVHLAVVRELANRRQGTHDTKSRSEVRGGGKKPYRQKGTGRARQGSIRAPQWRTGGVVHGPTPRSYAKGMPKKMRRAALLEALSGKAAAGAVRVTEGLSIETISTKALRQLLDRFELNGKAMVVIETPSQAVTLSARNLPNVQLRVVSYPAKAAGDGETAPPVFRGLSTYEVVAADTLLFTRGALERLQEAYAE